MWSVDLSNLDAAEQLARDAWKAFGGLDAMVHNAAIPKRVHASRLSFDDVTETMNVNFYSPVRMTMAMMPEMLARKSGMIVNVASVAALTPPPMQAYYGASKAGLAAFSEATRGELAGSGVHLLTVYPGPVKTSMGEAGWAAFGGRENLPPVPEGTPEELARRIRRAMEKRKSRLIYPRFYVTARWLPWLSRFLTDRYAPRAPRP